MISKPITFSTELTGIIFEIANPQFLSNLKIDQFLMRFKVKKDTKLNKTIKIAIAGQ
jgi:hypothetical protein